MGESGRDTLPISSIKGIVSHHMHYVQNGDWRGGFGVELPPSRLVYLCTYSDETALDEPPWAIHSTYKYT